MSMYPQGRGPRHTVSQEDATRLRERFAWLNSFEDNELGELVFLSEGETMRPGEEYFDISNPERGIFGGNGERADEDSRYVPRSEIPGGAWEKLTRTL